MNIIARSKPKVMLDYVFKHEMGNYCQEIFTKLRLTVTVVATNWTFNLAYKYTVHDIHIENLEVYIIRYRPS